MECIEKISKPNPRERASAISRLLFLWIIPLFRAGFKKDLSFDDIYDVPSEDASKKLGIAMTKAWEHEDETAGKKGRSPKFFKALFKVFGTRYMIVALAVLFDECIIRLAQPITLRLLIRSFRDDPGSQFDHIIYGLALCLTSFLHALVIHPLSFTMLHIGMKCRIASTSLIYKKEETRVGQLINLVSNDTSRFDMNLMFIPYLVIGPIQTLLCLYILWEEFGVASLAGVGFVFLLMPVQYYIGVLSRRLRFQLAKRTDERCRLLNEAIGAIQVIKLYCWEQSFVRVLNQLRRDEVNVLKRRAYLKAFYLSMFLSSKKLIPYITFLAYIHFGHYLSPDKVFFAVAIFDIIITTMVSTLPSAAAGAGELTVAISRIQQFLLLEEKCTGMLHNNALAIVPSIKMCNISACWETGKPCLRDLSIHLEGSKLVMVVGMIGSGKTSLLQSVLGELSLQSGKCSIEGTLTYCRQDPWIFPASARQNILFGKEFDEKLYGEVVHMCALTTDFQQLPQGDLTFIGEKGATLSGGQKARIGLARALYKDADIYLLDDPLSAVDSRVSSHVFQNCFKTYLAKRLVILVTHQLQYLPQADHIVVMDKGSIVRQGTYHALLQEGVDFVKLNSSVEENPGFRRQNSLPVDVDSTAAELLYNADAEPGQCQTENKPKGSVRKGTYWTYFSSGGSNFSLLIVAFGFVLGQVLYSASEYLLSIWTNAEHLASLSHLVTNDTPTHVSETPHSDQNGRDHNYISLYTYLVLFIAFVASISSFLFFRYCMKIAVNVHSKMLLSIFRAPMNFFDRNPSGRILNRFAKDLLSMDEHLPSTTIDCLSSFLNMVGVIALVIVSNHYVTIPSAILCLSLWLLRKFFIQTARDIKRIESIARSPLFTHMTSSMEGLTTIRALQSQVELIKQFERHQDTHSASWFLFISSNRWFGMTLDLLTTIFLLIVTYSFVIMANSGESGFVGLAISSVLGLTFKFQWGMRQSAEMECSMTSVERCLEFANMEPELDKSKAGLISSAWPQEGCITFQHVSLTYEGKAVLHDLSFLIKPKEKIGIVGRTGAGKSSIIAALFRITEVKGDIYIDDVNTSQINLQDLRSRISIIPQVPLLFSGTLRYNLDPFEDYEDKDMWRVLEQVGLNGDVVEGLDMKVNEGGINFSFGQRQLVCLARAMLRRNRIIVLDEATAGVDPKTDDKIKETVAQHFSDCTVICIAHRLRSVMHCDRILVLENGTLQEFDRPRILLEDKQSYLYKMAVAVGPTVLADLKKQAGPLRCNIAFESRDI